MLPPSSPQASQPQHNFQASILQRPPPPPPFSGNRELPALSTAPRPGSSMSISSMLGTDPGRPARESIPYLHPTASKLTSIAASPSVPAQSPTRAYHSGSADQCSRSPENYKTSHMGTTRQFRAYSGGSPRRSTSSADATLSEASKFGAAPSFQPSPYSPSPDNGSRQDWKNAHNKSQSTDRMTQRPNSQPISHGTSALDVQDRTQQPFGISEINELRRLQGAKRYIGKTENTISEAAVGQARRDYRDSQLIPEPRLEPQTERRPGNPTTHTSPNQNRSQGLNYPFLARSSANSEIASSRFGSQVGSVVHSALERNSPTSTTLSQSPFSPESLRRLRDERLAVGTQQHSITLSPANPQSRLTELVEPPRDNAYARTASVPATLGAPPTANSNDHRNRSGDDMSLIQKSSVSIFMDSQKRGGRVSPLPQAVQGAQGKLSTPASDPGIKNEFERMFIGIGSGVGSIGPIRSETSTPFQQSPTRNQEPERRAPFGTQSDVIDSNKPRAGSRVGRRVRKPKEDLLQIDKEHVDGRASVGATSFRGMKRSRPSQQQYVSSFPSLWNV